MFIFGIIAGALAVLLSVVGFVIITFGLWKSFAKDAFNRAIYLGLALISTAAIIFALSGPIFAGGLIFDLLNAQDDEPVASAPVEEYVEPEAVVEEDPVTEDAPIEEEVVEGDNDLEDTSELGIEVPSDLSVAVTGVERSTTLGPEEYVDTAQGEYVLVGVDLTNNSAEGMDISEDEFTLVDVNGYEYETSSDMPIVDDILIYESVNPGNSITGQLLFDVPAGTELSSIIYWDEYSENSPVEVPIV